MNLYSIGANVPKILAHKVLENLMSAEMLPGWMETHRKIPKALRPSIPLIKLLT